MRLIFIPGLGEDEFIFSKILPLIEGEKLVLNTWTLHGNVARGKNNAIIMAKEIIDKYQLKSEDIIIGHSMGGLLALAIKQTTGSKIIQIASFTHHNRVIVPITNHTLIKCGVKSRLFFNSLVRWLIVTIQYNKKLSAPALKYAFDLIVNGDKNNVINQLTVALTPVKTLANMQPEVRIHAKRDLIIRPPKEPFSEVPGDHFCLFTHPNEVATIINSFLKEQVVNHLTARLKNDNG